MTVSFHKSSVCISKEQLSKLDIAKYYTTNQGIKVSHCQEEIPSIVTKSTTAYIVLLKSETDKKNQKGKILNFSKTSLFRNKLLCKNNFWQLVNFKQRKCLPGTPSNMLLVGHVNPSVLGGQEHSEISTFLVQALRKELTKSSQEVISFLCQSGKET